MANSTFNGRRFSLDTLGVVYTKPLWIAKIIVTPNAAGDIVTFASWNENASATSSKYIETATVSSNKIIGSTANFKSTDVSALDIIKITTTASDNNVGTYLVLTRDNDNQITTTGASLTNETSILYTWKTWTPTTEIVVKCDAATGAKADWEVDFGSPGRWFPNLVMTTLSSSATAQIILG